MRFDELSFNSYGSMSKSIDESTSEADIVEIEIVENFEHAAKLMNREYESPVSELFALDGLGNVPKERKFLRLSD